MIINIATGWGGGSGSGYTLPIATSSVLGGVMIGSGITIDSAGTISADVAQDLSGLFAGVEYDSSATSINFYDREGTLVGQVDASSFVIDGMIEDVYITGNTMVIEFNTEAGKQDIEIDLTDIFDPANYYTKSEVDAEITAATTPIQSQVDDMERVTATALTELHDSIIDLSGATEDMATQTWVNEQNFVNDSDIANFVTSGEVETQISTYTGYTSAEDFDELAAKMMGKEEVVASALTELYESIAELSGATDDFVTSGEVETQITSKGYITGYTLPIASSNSLGGIKIGSGLTIDANGVVSSQGGSYVLPPATYNSLGGVKVGQGISVSSDGTIEVTYNNIGDTLLYWDLAGECEEYDPETGDVALYACPRDWNSFVREINNPYLNGYSILRWVPDEYDPETGEIVAEAHYERNVNTKAEITAMTQNYVTSGEVETQIASYTGFTSTDDFDDLVDMMETKEEVVASALTELNVTKVGNDTSFSHPLVCNIIQLTETEYNAIVTKDPNTLYLIITNNL